MGRTLPTKTLKICLVAKSQTVTRPSWWPTANMFPLRLNMRQVARVPEPSSKVSSIPSHKAFLVKGSSGQINYCELSYPRKPNSWWVLPPDDTWLYYYLGVFINCLSVFPITLSALLRLVIRVIPGVFRSMCRLPRSTPISITRGWWTSMWVVWWVIARTWWHSLTLTVSIVWRASRLARGVSVSRLTIWRTVSISRLVVSRLTSTSVSRLIISRFYVNTAKAVGRKLVLRS